MNWRVFFAIFAGMAVSGGAILTYTTFPDGTTLNRIAVLLGGNFLEGGYIQFLTYVAFFWAFFEILKTGGNVKKEQASISLKLLPEKEHFVIYEDDVNDIQKKVIDLGDEKEYLLTAIIKKEVIIKIATVAVVPMIARSQEEETRNIAKDVIIAAVVDEVAIRMYRDAKIRYVQVI